MAELVFYTSNFNIFFKVAFKKGSLYFDTHFMENKLTQKESLELITQMISRAKDSNHSTGLTSIMWGCVITVCSLVRLAEIHFQRWLPFDIYLLTVLAIAPTIYFTIKEKRESRVKGYKDSFIDYTWLSFGISIFLLSFIVNHVFAGLRPLTEEYKILSGHAPAFSFYDYMSSFFLMLYGLPTFITGASMKFRPMFWGGLVCWVSCIVSLYTPVKTDLVLTAISAIFAWLIPGIILEKDYRKAKAAMQTAHV